MYFHPVSHIYFEVQNEMELTLFQEKKFMNEIYILKPKQMLNPHA